MELTSDTKFVISILLATVLVIGGGAYISYKKTPNSAGRIIPDTLTNRLVQEDSAAIGPKDAKVTFVEFGDFQCPSCAALHPTLKEVKEKYANASVRFVFRHYPLPQHEHAFLASEAAVAAGTQGKFWEFHDMLFENQTNIKKENLQAYAEKLGLDTAVFNQALEDHAHKSIVEADMADGVALGVRGTPTLFINNLEYKGKYTVEDLSTAVDAALNK